MHNYRIAVCPVETEGGTEWIARYPNIATA